MTIFDLDRQVVNEYERFARSFTTIGADDLRSQLEGAYAGRRFWPEPMLQINSRFKEGDSVGQLVANGDLFPVSTRFPPMRARTTDHCSSTSISWTPSRSPISTATSS